MSRNPTPLWPLLLAALPPELRALVRMLAEDTLDAGTPFAARLPLTEFAFNGWTVFVTGVVLGPAGAPSGKDWDAVALGQAEAQIRARVAGRVGRSDDAEELATLARQLADLAGRIRSRADTLAGPPAADPGPTPAAVELVADLIVGELARLKREAGPGPLPLMFQLWRHGLRTLTGWTEAEAAGHISAGSVADILARNAERIRRLREGGSP
jgi:hypothetical protein